MVAAHRPLRPRAVPPRVLLTGFAPFGGNPTNPSALVARALHGRQIAGHRVHAAELPTAFGAATDSLDALLAEHQPVLVVCLGLASGRAALSLERVAINLDDASIADNAGAQPIDTPVVAGAPAAYFSTLPIKAMAQVLQHTGVPVELSHTAGTFVCNHVFFTLMHRLATVPTLAGARGGFIHVPQLPDMGAPSLPLELMVQGVRTALQVALTTTADLRLTGGAVH